MGGMASQITSLTIAYSNVYLGADQRKHQSTTSLAFVQGIHRWPVNSPHKGPVTRKMFPFDDVIMIYASSGIFIYSNYFHWPLTSCSVSTKPQAKPVIDVTSSCKLRFHSTSNTEICSFHCSNVEEQHLHIRGSFRHRNCEREVNPMGFCERFHTNCYV